MDRVSHTLRRIKITSKNTVAFKRSLNIPFPGFSCSKCFPLFCFLLSFSLQGFFFVCVFEPYNFSRNPLKGLKCKYYTKSLFASKLHDPRYDLLSGFPLVSMNNQLAGRRVGDLAFVRRNLQNKTNQQR